MASPGQVPQRCCVWCRDAQRMALGVDDLESAVESAKRLGAVEEIWQPAPERWRVMRDPAGHLFCLSHHVGDYLPLDS